MTHSTYAHMNIRMKESKVGVEPVELEKWHPCHNPLEVVGQERAAVPAFLRLCSWSEVSLITFQGLWLGAYTDLGSNLSHVSNCWVWS